MGVARTVANERREPSRASRDPVPGAPLGRRHAETTVVLFKGGPEPGAELKPAHLPGLLSYLADSGGEFADAADFLQHPAHLVAALEGADWPVDGDVLDALKQAESGPVLRRWSDIVRALLESHVISEELERRTAQAATGSSDEEEEDV